jgi:hypothetical protein
VLDPFCGIETNAPNLMIFLNGYFDESGKVHDHKQRVVSVGGFLARSFQWQGFHEKWMELLGTNGLKELKFTQAIRFRNPFGQKVSAVGRDARVKALLPFIHAARTSLEFGVVSTVNADAFRELSK